MLNVMGVFCVAEEAGLLFEELIIVAVADVALDGFFIEVGVNGI
jgi:hypothetical protein